MLVAPEAVEISAVAVAVERSGARRPRRRGFAGQRHSDFRGGQRGFGDQDFHGPVRMVKNRFPDLWGVWVVPAEAWKGFLAKAGIYSK